MDNLPKGWKIVDWSDVTTKIGDIDHKMPKETTDGYPYISPRDFRPNNKIDFLGAKKISEKDYVELSRKIKPEKGDIIFARYGTIGENRFVEEGIDFLASYSCAIIKHNLSKVLPEFSFYYSISPQVKIEIEKYINRATQPNIGIQSISKFLFPLPSLSEQTRIVAKLDALFARIDKSIALLEENIKHTKALMASVLEEVYSNSLKISKLSSLDKVCIKITDGSHFSPKSHDSGYPYITVKDIDNKGFIDFDNSKRISVESYLDLLKSGCQPQKGDVLFSKDGTVGKVSVVDFQKEWVVLSSLAILRPNLKILLPEYLGIILKTPTFQNSAIGLKTGAAIKRIVLKTIKEIEIPLPGLKEQKIFFDYYKTVNLKIEKISSTQQSKLVYLKALKSSLLDRVFKGEL